MSHASKRYTADEEAKMRAAGLRPVTIWVPDTSRPGFAEELARQVEAIKIADASDPSIESFSEAALADLDLPPDEEW